jgi:hypothetical protein
MRILLAGALALGLAGCASHETVQFKPCAKQQSLIRDGQLHIQPLVSDQEGPKTYTISVLVGSERHEIDISQVVTR